MPTADNERAGSVRNHWWWRPGWRAGRHFYACHLSMEDQPQLRDLIRRYQDALAHLGNLDLIPARWLHLTMQGIGFVDEISPAELTAITKRIADRLRDVPVPAVTFDQPTVAHDAVSSRHIPPSRFTTCGWPRTRPSASALGTGQFHEDPPEHETSTPRT